MNFRRSQVFWFVGLLALIFAGRWWQWPSQTWQAEPWAEMATNFFASSWNFSFREIIFLPDFNYWPLLQRLFSHSLIHIFGMKENFFFWAFFIGHFLSAAACSALILDCFSEVIFSRFLRATLALSFGLFPDFETHSFINFIYLLFPLLLFFALSSGPKKENLKMSTVFWSILGGLVFLSKGFFIALLPLFIGMMFFPRWKAHRIVFFVWVLALAAQFIYILMHWIPPSSEASLLSAGMAGVYFTFSQLLRLLFHPLLSIRPQFFFWSGIFFLGLVWWGRKKGFTLSRDSQTKLNGVLLLVVALLGNVMSCLSNSEFWRGAFSEFPRFYEVPLMRSSVLSYFALMTFVFLLLEKFSFRKKTLFVVGLLSLLFFTKAFVQTKDPRDLNETHSNWSRFSSRLNSSAFFIPVNPFPWSLKKNVELSEEFLESSLENSSSSSEKEKVFSLSPDILGFQVEGRGQVRIEGDEKNSFVAVGSPEHSSWSRDLSENSQNASRIFISRVQKADGSFFSWPKLTLVKVKTHEL